ncbi:hypothetical protein B0H14DRAFT_2594444 [Mycena olivaceomarginata]|nr:hypothetical protein B0H14DRAFT_2594444 [Mycena olivaceomarginata]
MTLLATLVARLGLGLGGAVARDVPLEAAVVALTHHVGVPALGHEAAWWPTGVCIEVEASRRSKSDRQIEAQIMKPAWRGVERYTVHSTRWFWDIRDCKRKRMVGGKDEDSDNDDNAQPPQLKQPLPPDILFVSWWVLDMSRRRVGGENTDGGDERRKQADVLLAEGDRPWSTTAVFYQL